jgi:predicted DNA-binding mobile mystery protein A
MSSKSASLPEQRAGWIRPIRKALGLSLATVGKRAGIHRQNVLAFEKSEETEQIKIQNLRRIAEAMDCDFVYAIIPRQSAIVDVAMRYAKTNPPKERRHEP